MKKTAAMQQRKSYVLVVLAVMFFATGLSRLGMGVAEVIAAESSVDAANADVAEVDTTGEDQVDPGDLFQTLRAREARLLKAEAELEERQERLREAEAGLERKISELIDAEAQLKATLRITETAAENDLQHLTTVFESMKPPQAAALFSEMDIEFAAGFLGRLRPEIAGEIMASLDPIVGYAISAVLAGRHSKTPRD